MHTMLRGEHACTLRCVESMRAHCCVESMRAHCVGAGPKLSGESLQLFRRHFLEDSIKHGAGFWPESTGCSSDRGPLQRAGRAAGKRRAVWELEDDAGMQSTDGRSTFN